MSLPIHSILVGIAPPVATLALCAWSKTPWKLVASLYLVIPMIGSIVVVTMLPERDQSVFSASFVYAVLGIYRLAIFTFGFVPAFFGALARLVLLSALARFPLGRLQLLVGGIVTGALFGAALLGVLAPTNRVGPSSDPYHAVLILLVTGAVSGGISGLFVAAYSSSGRGEGTSRTPSQFSPAEG
jgi:hypothetical protein